VLIEVTQKKAYNVYTNCSSGEYDQKSNINSVALTEGVIRGNLEEVLKTHLRLNQLQLNQHLCLIRKQRG